MSKTTYALWAPADSPVTIEYSVDALEDARQLAADGFLRLARGGVEVGGVLFGLLDGTRIRVDAVRAVDCSYSRGPFFVLSDGDRRRFVQVMESHQTDPGLAGRVPVGWFVSHSRSILAASDNDLTIFNAYFPKPWQVLLVLRPGRMGGARAGFFVRASDGSFHGGASHLEFNLEPKRAAAPAAPPAPGPQPRTPVPPPPSLSGRELPPRKSKKWFWVAAAAVLLGVVSAGAWLLMNRKPELAPVKVRLQEFDGEMRVEWDPTTPTISKSTQATLEITDGEKHRVVNLDASRLWRGAYPFLRESGDVNVMLKVMGPDNFKSQESARFVGPPLKRPETVDSEATNDERKRLTEANEKLAEDLKARRMQVQSLEKRVADLENMLRIERDRSAVFNKKAP